MGFPLELAEDAWPRFFRTEKQHGGGFVAFAWNRNRDREAMAPTDRAQIRRAVQQCHSRKFRKASKIRCIGRDGRVSAERCGRNVGLAGFAQRPGDDSGRFTEFLHALHGRRQQRLQIAGDGTARRPVRCAPIASDPPVQLRMNGIFPHRFSV